MSEQAWDHEIELRKDTFKVKVGDTIYEFSPELESERYLEAYAHIVEVRDSRPDGAPMTSEFIKKQVKANREFLATLMEPESRADFLAHPLPERVVGIMAQKVMENYSGGVGQERPTGSSNDSPAGSLASGRRSTGISRSKASTPESGQ